MDEIAEIGLARVLKCARDGEQLRTAADVNDFIGSAFSAQADVIAIPVERLGPDFLKLRTGVAGEVFQKFVNYRIKCAIVGDIASALAESSALRDFVREANSGTSIYFVADFEELRARLERAN